MSLCFTFEYIFKFLKPKKRDILRKMQFFSLFQSVFSILKYILKTSYYEIKQFASI